MKGFVFSNFRTPSDFRQSFFRELHTKKKLLQKGQKTCISINLFKRWAW